MTLGFCYRATLFRKNILKYSWLLSFKIFRVQQSFSFGFKFSYFAINFCGLCFIIFFRWFYCIFHFIYDKIYLLRNSDETKDYKKTNKIPLKEENYLFLDIYWVKYIKAYCEQKDVEENIWSLTSNNKIKICA